MPIFKGNFSQKVRSNWYRFLKYVLNYGYYAKKHAEFWLLFEISLQNYHERVFARTQKTL